MLVLGSSFSRSEAVQETHHCHTRTRRTQSQHDNSKACTTMGVHSLRLIRFLYMTRHPHSRHRIGSRALISFDAAQSLQGGTFQDSRVE